MVTRFFARALPETFPNPFTDVVQQQPIGSLTTRTYEKNIVDYRLSDFGGIDIDLERQFQDGGFAQGDQLNEIGDVSGSVFNDVIRGSDLIQAALELVDVGGGVPPFLNGLLIINNPGHKHAHRPGRQRPP